MLRSDSTLHPLLITAPAVLLVHALVLWWLQAAFQAPDKQETPILLSVRMLPPPASLSPSTHSTPSTPSPSSLPSTPTATPKKPSPRSARNSQHSPQPPQPTPAPPPTAASPSANAPPPQQRNAEAPAPKPTTAPLTTAPSTTAATTTGPVSATSAAPDKTNAHIELPISRASYLHNPEPAYPEISLRRREQGRVVINAFIGTDGLAHQTVVYRSSGYPRLDDAALAAVKTWRFVPGKRAGVPEAMWFSIPFSFGEKD